jgi:hypothetical protein
MRFVPASAGPDIGSTEEKDSVRWPTKRIFPQQKSKSFSQAKT